MTLADELREYAATLELRRGALAEKIARLLARADRLDADEARLQEVLR